MVVIEQKLLYSKNSGCFRAIVVVFGKIGFIRINWLYLTKLLHSGKSGSTRATRLYSDKLVDFGQKWYCSGKIGCIRAKGVLFRQKWLCSGKSGCVQAKVVLFGQSCCIQ